MGFTVDTGARGGSWMGGSSSGNTSSGLDLGELGEDLGKTINKKMADDDEKKKKKIAAAKAAIDQQKQEDNVTKIGKTTIIDAGHNPSEAKISGLRKAF